MEPNNIFKKIWQHVCTNSHEIFCNTNGHQDKLHVCIGREFNFSSVIVQLLDVYLKYRRQVINKCVILIFLNCEVFLDFRNLVLLLP